MNTLCCILLAVVCWANPAWSGIVENGGFEARDLERARPASWHPNARPGNGWVEHGWDRETAHTGDASIFIHIRSDYPEDKKNITWMWTSKARGVAVGEKYRLRAWLKTDGLGFTPTVLVQFRDASDRFLSRADTHTQFPLIGSTEWTQVTTEFEVPPNTSHIKIRAAVRAMDNAGGTVWFDDISLEKVER